MELDGGSSLYRQASMLFRTDYTYTAQASYVGRWSDCLIDDRSPCIKSGVSPDVQRSPVTACKHSADASPIVSIISIYYLTIAT